MNHSRNLAKLGHNTRKLSLLIFRYIGDFRYALFDKDGAFNCRGEKLCCLVGKLFTFLNNAYRFSDKAVGGVGRLGRFACKVSYPFLLLLHEPLQQKR